MERRKGRLSRKVRDGGRSRERGKGGRRVRWKGGRVRWRIRRGYKGGGRYEGRRVGPGLVERGNSK